MAIYHFTVTVISRARGQRAVAAAAAQAAAKLRDDYYGVVHNHSSREGVDFTEIVAPAAAPTWVFDRERLWNRVEAGERRQDSQLARALEISLPSELQLAQSIDLLREFVRAEFVMRGMVADMSIRRTALGHRNAHVLLTFREAGDSGFGPKRRDWNRKNDLMSWRQAWANCANLHLARCGHGVRIDHRSFDEQQIELSPARRTGIGRSPADLETLPEHLRARYIEQRRIAHQNGAAIVEDASIAIRALARQRRNFTVDDVQQFLASRSEGQAQLAEALSAVMASAELIPLTTAQNEPKLYTSRDLMEADKALRRRAQNMMKRGDFQAVAVTDDELNLFLQDARKFWRERGKQVRDAMPSPGDALTMHDAVLLQGAEMMDLKTLEKNLDTAERARATLVLVANADRLQAMGGESPMQGLVARDSPLDS